MNLQQLRYVVAVAEFGTMTRAAQTLHVGQPALTQAIRALERELGVTLFDRTSRGVELTDAGRVLVAGAHRALAELDDTSARVQSIAEADRVVLRFAMRPAAARVPGVQLVARLREAHPDVVVRVVSVEHVGDVTDLLLAGEADLALTDLPAPVTGLVTHEVGRHRFVAFFPPGSPVPAGGITWSDLARYPLIGIEKSDARWRAADSSFLQEGAMPDVVVEATQRDLMLPLVAAGVGATVGYEYLREEAERLGVVTAPFEPEQSRAVELVRQRHALAPHVEACWDLITGADRSPSLI